MSIILDGDAVLDIEMFVYILDELGLATNDDDLTIRNWFWKEMCEHDDEMCEHDDEI